MFGWLENGNLEGEKKERHSVGLRLRFTRRLVKRREEVRDPYGVVLLEREREREIDCLRYASGVGDFLVF